jgi:hypothetical protein
MGMEGGDQGRAEITVSYLHHNMNDSAEKKTIIYTLGTTTYTHN